MVSILLDVEWTTDLVLSVSCALVLHDPFGIAATRTRSSDERRHESKHSVQISPGEKLRAGAIGYGYVHKGGKSCRLLRSTSNGDHKGPQSNHR